MNIKQQLISLHAENSKHSGYQLLPDKLASIIGQDNIAVKSRYEHERLNFILRNISIEGCDVLDIGGNTGFFTFELIDKGANRLHHYEGNKAHSDFVKTASKALNYEDKIEVTNEYYTFKTDDQEKYDVALLLNVLHHLGDDYGDTQISINAAKQQMAAQMNNMAKITKYLIFQLGFCWKGDRNLGLFENGTKRELIKFVEQASRDVWQIKNIGIPVEVGEKYEYVDLDENNIERKDSYGEFLNRPLFIMRSLLM